MDGGDPYIRALMRTISASESHDPEPYSLIYGGDRAEDWDEHPDRCVPIVAGPNIGNCTTAAGRYQFITTTWLDQAQRYHPNPGGLWRWRTYSFTPEAQDKTVYRWLNDPAAWNADLGDLLRQGQIEEVLYLLSPTWTSLGYGIETNNMSASLPWIYEELLQDELANAEK
ncbi:MAG: glycoside hydrolase family protein [Kaiparowitsia implicata GSE-PSE-MK54-09C]|jgi:muramidase (phage lysozyme)|nr:glycoside hydrolase family protein [Kaiparowitsia implicata GSE-PSE-MK54-09C]